jgi:hypothetical protein
MTQKLKLEKDTEHRLRTVILKAIGRFAFRKVKRLAAQ